MDGQLGVAPARIVASGPGDIALIAVPVHPDYAARLGASQRVEYPVFAVACNHAQAGVGGELTLVSGNLVGADAEALRSDLPLWYGDSGGPLLDAQGGLIGINSSIRFSWLNGGGYVRLSVPVNGVKIGILIAADQEKLARNSGLRR
jgi:hypothetical protein